MPGFNFPVLDAIEKIVECNYTSFFKGAIALIALALAGLSQTIPSYIESEYKAKEMIFQIEAKENNKFTSINCTDLNSSSQVNCKIAVYLQYRNNLFIYSTVAVVCLFLAAATVLLYLAFIGFIGAAKIYSKQNLKA